MSVILSNIVWVFRKSRQWLNGCPRRLQSFSGKKCHLNENFIGSTIWIPNISNSKDIGVYIAQSTKKKGQFEKIYEKRDDFYKKRTSSFMILIFQSVSKELFYYEHHSSPRNYNVVLKWTKKNLCHSHT